MNLSDNGCPSGAVGTIPIRLGDVDGAIENGLVRMTVSSTGFWYGILGGMVAGPTAGAILDAVAECLSAIASQSFDINADLSGDTQTACDALPSAELEPRDGGR